MRIRCLLDVYAPKNQVTKCLLVKTNQRAPQAGTSTAEGPGQRGPCLSLRLIPIKHSFPLSSAVSGRNSKSEYTGSQHFFGNARDCATGGSEFQLFDSLHSGAEKKQGVWRDDAKLK